MVMLLMAQPLKSKGVELPGADSGDHDKAEAAHREKFKGIWTRNRE